MVTGDSGVPGELVQMIVASETPRGHVNVTTRPHQMGGSNVPLLGVERQKVGHAKV